jgi:hypothetical protein
MAHEDLEKLIADLPFMGLDACTQSPEKRDIKIGGGTHLLHLEAMRPALWQESIRFLLGGASPVPA